MKKEMEKEKEKEKEEGQIAPTSIIASINGYNRTDK